MRCKYLDFNNVIRTIPINFNAEALIGKIFIVTGTGKYFKNVEYNPETNLGIIRIAKDGTTAELLWGLHGIYGAGRDMDETFGLIETVEKAAQLYMLTAHLPHLNTISDNELREVAEAFGIDYRKDFLNL